MLLRRGGVSPLPCSARAVAAPPYSGNVPLHQIPRAGFNNIAQLYSAAGRFPCGKVPQTAVAAALFRENALLHYQAYCADSGVSPRPDNVNNITMPRSGRRLRRATFYYLKQIARARHTTLCWVVAACRRSRVPRTGVITLPNQFPRTAVGAHLLLRST